jgi:hypothetical protein
MKAFDSMFLPPTPAGREGKDERQTKGKGTVGKLGKGSGKVRNLL